MRNVWLCAFVGALVAGCGGGDGGSGTNSGASSNTPPPAVAQQLSQYIGTWTSECQHHQVDTVVVTRTAGTTDSIDIAGKTDYFVAADCTGPIVATATDTGIVTSRFVATTDSTVTLTPSSAGVISKIDQVTTSVTHSTLVLTGSGIYHTVEDGMAEVCVDFGGVERVCRTGVDRAAESGIAEGLLLQGGTFYTLAPSGSGYIVELKYTKKTG